MCRYCNTTTQSLAITHIKAQTCKVRERFKQYQPTCCGVQSSVLPSSGEGRSQHINLYFYVDFFLRFHIQIFIRKDKRRLSGGIGSLR